MKSYILFLIFLSTSYISFSQEKASTLDFKVGVGLGHWINSNLNMFRFENEFTKKWNRSLSSSLSINFASGGNTYLQTLTLLNGNINCFLSPFGNQKKNNFKIGTGISFIHIRETVVTYFDNFPPYYDNPRQLYEVNKRQLASYNLVIDDEIVLGDKYLIGVRLMMQPYRVQTGDTFWGLLFKCGIKL